MRSCYRHHDAARRTPAQNATAVFAVTYIEAAKAKGG